MLYGELPEITLPNGEKTRGIKVSVPNPPKVALIGLPSNEQMIERLDQQKSIRRSLGRRKSQTEFVPNIRAEPSSKEPTISSELAARAAC